VAQAMNYELGRGLDQYMDGRAQYCTLVLTEQCNLRCKYCYQLGKNAQHRMSLQTACRAIDFFLQMEDPQEGLVLEFTGGECTLEVDLMRDVIEYFRSRLTFAEGHPWRSSYMFMFSTNGILYDSDNFQRLLWENRGHSYPAITIDGSKRKHDRARVFQDGRGSYDIVERNVRLWLKQYPSAGTKITFSSEDLPFVSECILHVWRLGIRNVAANVVFEDVWRPGDAQLYESQLCRLADAAIEEGWWRTSRCNLFWSPRSARSGQTEEDEDRNWCGTGKMVSVDAEGNLFPCLRFQGFCLGHRPGRPIGTIYHGIDQDVLRAFYCLRKSLQSPSKCLECDMSEQCAWCSAHNYDSAKNDTIFERATFICEMHRARWRANQYYWGEINRRFGIVPGGRAESGNGCPF
jgi:uncharacterized protein